MWKRKLVLLIYRLVTLLFLPFILFLLSFRILTKKEDAARVIERFGFSFNSPEPGAKYIWIHAASIGEMNVAITLIRSLNDDSTKHHFLLTTQTLSAARVFEHQQEMFHVKHCVHHFLPYDISFIADYFLHKWRPALAVFVESEIWPLYLSVLDCPTLLLNARISDQSLKKWLYIKRLAKLIFANFNLICAATNEDQKRYQKLYRAAECVGNIKLCTPKLQYSKNIFIKFKEFYSSGKKPLVILASTSVDEIDGIVWLVEQLHERYNFIIVPRHASDAKLISPKLKALKIQCKVRSNYTEPFKPVYIANTYNELGLFFSIADVVFIGGSMHASGGQNMLEPIKIGVPTIVGPSTYNFESIMDELRQHSAIVEVSSFAKLRDGLHSLIVDKKRRNTIVANIEKFNSINSGILQNYKNVIYKYLK